MTSSWPLSIGVGLALLAVGALIGELWSRRRRPRRPEQPERPHYLRALGYLASQEPTRAVRELARAVHDETHALEPHVALGNLFRETGQADRAIEVHKSLLHRPDLSEGERLHILLSLGEDFRRAGLSDRAERTFREVLELDLDNVSGLRRLQGIHEEFGRWGEAIELYRRLRAVGEGGDIDLLPAMHTEWAKQFVASDSRRAADHYRKALDLDAGYAPALVGIAALERAEGKQDEAVKHLAAATSSAAPWPRAAVEALSDIALECGALATLERVCGELLERDPRAWWAALALGRSRLHGGDAEGASDVLAAALRERPHAFGVQRALWRALASAPEGRVAGGSNGRPPQSNDPAAARLTELLDASVNGLVDEPYVCLECRFRGLEPFTRCPHCHGWNTLGEERA